MRKKVENLSKKGVVQVVAESEGDGCEEEERLVVGWVVKKNKPY